jgi:hypothetical protein
VFDQANGAPITRASLRDAAVSHALTLVRAKEDLAMPKELRPH